MRRENEFDFAKQEYMERERKKQEWKSRMSQRKRIK